MAWLAAMASERTGDPAAVTGSVTAPGLELAPVRALSDGPVNVRLLNAPAGSRIRYTTNGTEPTLRNGSDFQTPWNLTQSTLLRIAAFSNGVAITPVSTHSYLILDDIVRQSPRPAGLPRTWD
jgi:hypothetical protein